MIRIWRAYSCNNSTSYRVVARFPDAAAAGEVAAELSEFFAAQARNRRRALTTLAQTYGFDFIDSGMTTPEVLVEHEVMVAYQSTSLGMGPGVGAFVEDRGGVAEPPSRDEIEISVLCRLEHIERIRLDELVAQLATSIDPEKGAYVQPSPWPGAAARGPAAWFRDAGTLGLHVAIRPSDVASLKKWLAGFGIEDPLIRLEDHDDLARFTSIARARCTACGGPLAYLDPRLHDIETPQLVCRPCGGFYDLAAFHAP